MPEFFKAKYIISTSDNILEESCLVVENGKITDIIKNSEIPAGAKITGDENSVISAGFCNFHSHLQFSGIKKLFKQDEPPKDVDFSDWIISLMKQYIFWSKDKKTDSFKKGLKEAVLSGCTSIVQLSRENIYLDILKDIDIKSFVFLEVFAKDEENSKSELEKIKNQISENSSENIVIGVSPHSVYNVHKCFWELITDFCVEKNIMLHTHLAESSEENAWLCGNTSGISKIHKLAGWNGLNPYENGLSPVEYLNKLGVLNKIKQNMTAAHCLEISGQDAETLASCGTGIAVCPRSNFLLHKKDFSFAKNYDLLEKNLCLGTDSLYSNYDLNILHEAKFAQQQFNADFRQIYKMLTENPSRLLKINSETGSLEKNKSADFLVFKINSDENYESIFQKDNPDKIFIKGNLIAENGEFISEKMKFLNFNF